MVPGLIADEQSAAEAAEAEAVAALDAAAEAEAPGSLEPEDQPVKRGRKLEMALVATEPEAAAG